MKTVELKTGLFPDAERVAEPCGVLRGGPDVTVGDADGDGPGGLDQPLPPGPPGRSGGRGAVRRFCPTTRRRRLECDSRIAP